MKPEQQQHPNTAAIPEAQGRAMLQPRIWASRGLLSSMPSAPPISLICALSRLSVASPMPSSISRQQTRAASHAAQGVANKAAPGPGKRLGAKKGDSQLVVPGNIIFKQRGTHWFPGENCGMGRDHTIYSLAKGYVRFYRDPERHKKRKYIGVTFTREETLPRGRNSARRRRLGMEEVVMAAPEPSAGEQLVQGVVTSGDKGGILAAVQQGKGSASKPVLSLRAGYQYRESNWSIGRTAERAGIKVREYNPKDRFLAWRKRIARRQRTLESRSMKKKKKK